MMIEDSQFSKFQNPMSQNSKFKNPKFKISKFKDVMDVIDNSAIAKVNVIVIVIVEIVTKI